MLQLYKKNIYTIIGSLQDQIIIIVEKSLGEVSYFLFFSKLC